MTRQQIASYFRYLDSLRESGVTNMFGGAPYLSMAHGLHIDDARKVLKEWMNLPLTETVEDRAEKANL